jgi:hypothetical protein
MRKPRLEIRNAEPHEMQAFYVEFSGTWADIFEYRTKIFTVKGLFSDGRPVGLAGLAKKAGKLWAFFDIMPGSHRIGMFLVLEMRRALVKLGRGHPIYAQLDDSCETACDLMRVLGFIPLNETCENMRVYQWQG